MNNTDLADEIIKRLNSLIENGAVRYDIEMLIEQRFSCT